MSFADVATRRNLAWIEDLQCIRATGMPIRAIRRCAELVRAGDGSEAERLALLEEHRTAVRAQLSAQDIEELDTAVSREAVHGDRYPEPMMALLNQ